MNTEFHSEYLNEFGDLFFKHCKNLIDRNQEHLKSYVHLDLHDSELATEILDHSYLCNDLANSFNGRTEILSIVCYLIIYNIVS